ncbi:unnamed protein product [Triticum turgidum subsp. durum]|uniref:Cytochrome P450 n=1 Tax=Triticum turgidum subsp. durum TaxID=4567 RepID=A0A9R1RKG2_TRITD|nr:unnamed protein product [Triticum turgidum subsp. durum]
MVLSALMSAASVPWSSLVCGTLGFVLLWQASRLVDLLWWHPRRLERALRAQGLRGTSYRFVIGDMMDYRRRRKEAQSRSMPLRCHSIAPLVAPLLCDIVREHGKTCMSWYAMYPKVTIHDPDLAKEVLSNKFGHFEKVRFPPLSRLLAAGLAEHEGEKWVKHRRILNPAFHLEKLKVFLMLPALSTSCEELVNRWTQSLGSDGTYELDVFPEFRRLTGDVISRTAFGSNYLEGARVFQLQSEQVERIAGAWKIGIPGYLSLPTKNNRKMHQNNSEIESILHGLIGKRMQAMQEGENIKDDLLGLMLESNMRTSDDNGQSISGMTIKEVTMILYEVLRLYSPAVAFFRKTYKEIKIGGITYPAGVLIELPLLLMNHDPVIWGRDAHEFKPERFTNGIFHASKNPGAFLPFSWGPRICIAQQFALLEAKMAFCMILQCFEFELAPSYTHAVNNIRLMRPLHGAQIKLTAI